MGNPGELEIKTERLISMMAAQGLGGVLINSQHNFAWFTSGGRNGIDLSREMGSSSLLVRRDGKRYVLANRIEMPRITAEEVSINDFEAVEFSWEAEKADSGLIAKTAAKIIETGLDLAADVHFGADIRVIEDRIANCRFRLTDPETDAFRLLGRDAGRVLGEIHSKITVGQTENEIAAVTRFELAKLGIETVVTLVAADQRIAAFRHPVPTENIWKRVLMIAVCAKRSGLIASLTRIFCAGELPGDLRRRTDAAAEVHAKIMHASVEGRTGSDVFDIITESYTSAGFPGEEAKHHQGGACGYRTRDWVAFPGSRMKVNLDQAFAWNPSITGTKSEETIIVRRNGIEIVTESVAFPRISTIIDGVEYFTPDILLL